MSASSEDSLKTLTEAIRLYETGLNIRQVAHLIGWSWGQTQTRLQRAGVTRTPGEGVHLSTGAEPFLPTEELVELVDGLVLGDASIEASTFGGRLSIGQSGEHQPWVLDLQEHLSRLGVRCGIGHVAGGPCIIKGKPCVRKPRTTLKTANYPWFKDQRSRWYPQGTKIIPQDVRLTPLSLAGWLCGDGVRAGKGYRVEFCTDGFAKSDVQWLVCALRQKYGWSPTISNRNRIVLCQQSDRDSLIAMVRPHIPVCFAHKLDLKDRASQYKATPATRAQILTLRGEGWSMDRLASHFGMSRSGMYGVLKSLGLATRVPRANRKRVVCI